MRDSALPSSFDQSESLLQATRRRLELWDLSEVQIDQVLKTGEPIKNITVYSPMTGYITERTAFPQVSHARHGPVHDRGSQSRLDHGGRVRVRSPEHPLRADATLTYLSKSESNHYETL